MQVNIQTRLVDLLQEVRELLQTNLLSVGHAKVLLGADPELRDLLAARTVAQGLSVRALEKLVSGMDAAAKRVRRPTSRPAAAEDAKARGLGTVSVDGRMVDIPVVKRAHYILIKAGLEKEAE